MCVQARGVWGHAPPGNFFFNRSSQIASHAICDKNSSYYFRIKFNVNKDTIQTFKILGGGGDSRPPPFCMKPCSSFVSIQEIVDETEDGSLDTQLST